MDERSSRGFMGKNCCGVTKSPRNHHKMFLKESRFGKKSFEGSCLRTSRDGPNNPFNSQKSGSGLLWFPEHRKTGCTSFGSAYDSSERRSRGLACQQHQQQQRRLLFHVLSVRSSGDGAQRGIFSSAPVQLT